jgi:general secretion pathway protein C
MKHIVIYIVVVVLLMGGNPAVIDAAQHSSPDAMREISVSNLQLKGTLFTESLNPLAIIEHSNNGQIIMYELGDDVEGLKIVYIARGEIKLSLAGKEYTLSFPGGGISQDSSSTDGDEKWYNIRRQGDVIITDQATITGAILRARDIMKDLKARPYSEDGKREGIAINALNQTGILKDIGVQEGDIIKSVNGFTLNSPYQVFNAYRNLRNKQELKVDIIRQGRPLTLTYVVEK